MEEPNQRRTAESSSRPTSAAIGAAVSTIFWTIAAATFWRDTFDAAAVAALTGASATVLAFVFSYFLDRPINRTLTSLSVYFMSR